MATPLAFPNINPVAVSLGPLEIHWYGIMYLVGFLLAWLLARYRVVHYKLSFTKEQISDLIFYAAIGVIIGGRVGYMVFYDTQQLITNPLSLFKIWQGGMSFHGGLIGVLLAVIFFARKTNKSFCKVADFLAPLVPLGLCAGRIGNFINGELWGRVTTEPWGIVFPQAGNLPRHPSQLYEASLEGIGLFILVWWYASTPRLSGRVSAIFLMGYAICRFIIEFYREPDYQLGFIAFNWLTMGQLLSIPLFIGGLFLYFYPCWRKKHANIS